MKKTVNMSRPTLGGLRWCWGVPGSVRQGCQRLHILLHTGDVRLPGPGSLSTDCMEFCMYALYGRPYSCHTWSHCHTAHTAHTVHTSYSGHTAHTSYSAIHHPSGGGTEEAPGPRDREAGGAPRELKNCYGIKHMLQLYCYMIAVLEGFWGGPW